MSNYKNARSFATQVVQYSFIRNNILKIVIK